MTQKLIGFAIIMLSVFYGLYLHFWVYIDQLLTTREKLVNYWPCYAGYVIGYILVKVNFRRKRI